MRPPVRHPSPGGVEGPPTMPCVQHCSSVTYESSARRRASRWLSRNAAKWRPDDAKPTSQAESLVAAEPPDRQ